MKGLKPQQWGFRPRCKWTKWDALIWHFSHRLDHSNQVLTHSCTHWYTCGRGRRTHANTHTHIHKNGAASKQFRVGVGILLGGTSTCSGLICAGVRDQTGDLAMTGWPHDRKNPRHSASFKEVHIGSSRRTRAPLCPHASDTTLPVCAEVDQIWKETCRLWTFPSCLQKRG